MQIIRKPEWPVYDKTNMVFICTADSYATPWKKGTFQVAALARII